MNRDYLDSRANLLNPYKFHRRPGPAARNVRINSKIGDARQPEKGQTGAGGPRKGS